MRFILALLLVSSATSSWAIERGQDYASARAELLSDGWDPAKVADSIDRNCNVRSDVCSAYPEVEMCAPTGSAACLFRFEKDGEEMTVSTENELVEDLIVTGWQ